MTPLSLLILDMDGVVVDSEPCHRAAYAQIRQELSQGREVHAENTPGSSSNMVYQQLLDACPPSCWTAEQLSVRHYELTWAKLEGTAKTVPGLRALLDAAKERGMEYAVASCSPAWFVRRCLASAGVLAEARAVLSGNCGLPVKPAPDLFLETLRRCGTPADQAVVVEDSHAGVLAAKNAGIRCIGFHNPTTGEQDLSPADWEVDGLDKAAALLRTIPARRRTGRYSQWT